ncbi:hypothetical protein ACFPES_18630 [Paenibacillus sp. GCM10023248]|uniref:hypothetical protein n=1 Tax=unclassified Paenibacillus TaxID=185978 RepID=UPI0023797D9B|nr:hypothetical protein [Paenibacillus sp. MAHUQ-63]MDD9269064.1 hypothetical protein [Paenibacillus sp. MAHUQ-63]
MKFCLYDTKYDRIILIENKFAAALSMKEKFGMSVDIAVLPLLSKDQYLASPPSFRGEVNGRFYLLYDIPGFPEKKYGQVIIHE